MKLSNFFRKTSPAVAETNYPKVPRLDYEHNAYEGYVDHCDDNSIRGWAFHRERPDEPLELLINDGDATLATITADQNRDDLKTLGKGNGKHGFCFDFPDALKNCEPHILHVQYAETGRELYRSPVVQPLFPADPRQKREHLIAHQIALCQEASPLSAEQLRDMQVFRNEHFPQPDHLPWLDRPDWSQQIEQGIADGSLTQAEAALCREYAEKGYVIVSGIIDDAELDQAWEAFMQSWRDGKLPMRPRPPTHDAKWGRVGNIHRLVPEMDAILRHPKLVALIELLLGVPCLPFQTIPSFIGSEQLAHSDAIHMTTFPLGYLAAAWIAFEDIHPESGPLEYYPGSHRLPYYLGEATGLSLQQIRAQGRQAYEEIYEPFIQHAIQDHGLERKYFTAKKGEILVWHHNLLHGGSKIKDPSKTRESLVCHYFGRQAVCYHDLVGELAYL